MDLNINMKKTKFIITTREPDTFKAASQTFEGLSVDRVNKFQYLGMWLCKDWSLDMESRR